MKYIVAQSLGREMIYVFDSSILHIHFASSLKIPRERILSAGFVSADGNGGILCHGASTSLGVSCRTNEDNALLRERLGSNAG